MAKDGAGMAANGIAVGGLPMVALVLRIGPGLAPALATTAIAATTGITTS